MPKFLIRISLFAFVVTVLIVIVASVLVNNFLAAAKNKIEQNLSRQLHQRVSIGRIAYLPPNFIILKDFSLSQDVPSPGDELFSADKIKLAISLGAFIRAKKFIVKAVYFTNPKADYLKAGHFLKDNIGQIITLLKDLPRQEPLTIAIQEAMLFLPKKDDLSSYVSADIILVINRGIISSSGNIGLKGFWPREAGKPKEELSSSYRFRGALKKENLVVESLEFKGNNYYTKFWGRINKNALRLYGFTSLHNFFKYQLPQTASLNITDKLRKIFKIHRPTFSAINVAAYDLNIYFLNCAVKFNFPVVEIDELSFSFKNMPFSLRGRISLSEPPELDLKLSSFPRQPPEERAKNPRRFDMDIKGALLQNKFKGEVNLAFSKETSRRVSQQRIESALNGLTFHYLSPREIKVSFDKADLSYSTDNNSYNIILEDFVSLLNSQQQRFKFIKVNSLIFDASLQGEGFIDMAQLPPPVSFYMQIRDGSANRFGGILSYFSKVYGSLSSNIYYRSQPQPQLEGELMVNSGLLDNLVFFNWLGDFFNLPALKKVNFNKLTANFLINNQEASLKKINLASPELTLRGYFTLKENDLVSSRLSLALSRKLLSTSPKFKSLLNALGKDISSVSFSFQLSGPFGAMNFKWLESDFKERLKKLLPSWIERGIERKVEEIISSISGE